MFIFFIDRPLVVLAGGYLAARLAPERPEYHALLLGGISFIYRLMTILMGSELNYTAPWYIWGIALLVIPAAWLGGKLHTWQPDDDKPKHNNET